MLPPDAFPRFKIFQKCVCGRAPGFITALPHPLAGFGGALRGGEGRAGEGPLKLRQVEFKDVCNMSTQ